MGLGEEGEGAEDSSLRRGSSWSNKGWAWEVDGVVGGQLDVCNFGVVFFSL